MSCRKSHQTKQSSTAQERSPRVLQWILSNPSCDLAIWSDEVNQNIAAIAELDTPLENNFEITDYSKLNNFRIPRALKKRRYAAERCLMLFGKQWLFIEIP